MHIQFIRIAVSLALIIAPSLGSAQTTEPAPQAEKRPPRAPPPTRDPNTAGFVSARELPDGDVPPPNADGNFVIGLTHTVAPQMKAQDGVPQGTIHNLTMKSSDSKIYP